MRCICFDNSNSKLIIYQRGHILYFYAISILKELPILKQISDSSRVLGHGTGDLRVEPEWENFDFLHFFPLDFRDNLP